jgi:hypothetical protein
MSATVYPYLIVYLAGLATPFVILRAVIARKSDDGSGCLLDFCITWVVILMLLVGYFWLLG